MSRERLPAPEVEPALRQAATRGARMYSISITDYQKVALVNQLRADGIPLRLADDADCRPPASA